MTLKSDKLKILKKNKKIKKNKEHSGEIRNTNSKDIIIQQNSLKRKIDIKLSIIGYLKDSYDISDLNSIKYYSPEIIEQIEKGNLAKNHIIQEDDIIPENEKKDEWACGVILHYLITGEFPFEGKTKEELFNNIKNEVIDYSSLKFDSVSEDCKDFLSKLLEKDKKKRMSAEKCFEHPFLLSFSYISTKNTPEEIYYDNLNNYWI